MIEPPVSFWRRLLPKRASASTSIAEQEDRRQSNRFPTELQLKYSPALSAERPVLVARVQNISRGGVNMDVDREYRPGDLLNVQLPSIGENVTTCVLACVVHVNKNIDNQWTIGCTFARDLSSEDLQSLTPDHELAAADLRAQPRQPCAINASYERIGNSDGKAQSATVLNLSTSGIALSVREVLNPGELLNIDLSATESAEPLSMLSCVVHVDHTVEGWTVGCNFITEMDDDALRALIGSKHSFMIQQR